MHVITGRVIIIIIIIFIYRQLSRIQPSRPACSCTTCSTGSLWCDCVFSVSKPEVHMHISNDLVALSSSFAPPSSSVRPAFTQLNVSIHVRRSASNKHTSAPLVPTVHKAFIALHWYSNITGSLWCKCGASVKQTRRSNLHTYDLVTP